jgi:hypothetical protein
MQGMERRMTHEILFPSRPAISFMAGLCAFHHGLPFLELITLKNNEKMNIYTFRTKNFKITVDAEEEFEPDFSFDETGETTREKVESGEWVCFIAVTRVFYHGSEIAIKYLGNCIHADPREFRDHVGSAGKWGSYFTDGIHEAIKEARAHFAKMPKLRRA